MTEELKHNNVHPIDKMTGAAFRKKREEIRAVYGDTDQSAAARRAQELAKLFAESHWTQQELAEEEGLERTYISRLLKFGNFLVPTGHISLQTTLSLSDISERHFRKLYSKTDQKKPESVRFAEVLTMLTKENEAQAAEDTPADTAAKDPADMPGDQEVVAEHQEPARIPLITALVDRYANGKYHLLPEMAKDLECTPKQIEIAMTNLRKKEPYKKKIASVDWKKYGTTKKYRIIKNSTGSVSVDKIRTDLEPLLESLEEEGQKNAATVSPQAVAKIAFDIRKAFQEWVLLAQKAE